MSARLEAAAKAMRFRLEGVPRNHGWASASEREQFTDDAAKALAAADAEMFSDEAVERAARALNNAFPLNWEKLPEWVREDERKTVRAVIAALKETDQ